MKGQEKGNESKERKAEVEGGGRERGEQGEGKRGGEVERKGMHEE